jgi:probable F420-dependent oxidoreductase
MDAPMKFGFKAPTSGPLSLPGPLGRIVQAGEGFGFDYVALSDHVALPRTIASRYPYAESGVLRASASGARQELLITMAWLAALTTRIRLLSSVMVVPLRPAVLAAKQLATIDVLSSGRLIVGIGAGWCEEEFAALGTPPFAERGAVTDEYLAAFKTLWTQEHPHFAGRHVRFDDLEFEHRPVQRPHPPIWVGGEGPPVMRRAARLGDAWYPGSSNAALPLDSLPRVEVAFTRLRRLTEEAGRAPDAVGLALRIQAYGETLPARATDGERRLFAGAPAEIAADLRALQVLGVSAVDVDFRATEADTAIAELQRFRDEVIALV